jgi:cyclopropane-fatty-acyl-phospholipid synthase
MPNRRLATLKISDSNLAKPVSDSKQLFGSASRQLLLALLGRLHRGSLLLVENNSEQVFGEPRQHAAVQATIVVRDPAAFNMILGGGSLGAAEAYMLGLWESPDLLQVIRLFVLNMDLLQRMDSKGSWPRRVAARVFHLLRRNTLQGSRANIAAHYDLSNDFFKLFLDSTMAYSSAIYTPQTTTLQQASENKFRHICQRLQLKPTDHLLEIGTGWGGLAIHAAQHHGCRVTTTTLSKEQAAHARAWVARAGLADRITVLEQDYRELSGQYDKLVSIEMIEAVGAEYYADYFRQLSSLLKPSGLALIQAITISDQRYAASLGNTDFIKRYIFPGGQLPSNAVIAQHVARDTDMQLIGLEDITHDYARTLRAWRDSFQAKLPEVRRLGFDETFIRMWRFYLCFCEGGFLERVIHTGQFLLAKPDFRALPQIRVE